MIITRHKFFVKHFKTRILQNKKLVDRFQKRLAIFINNPQETILKDHQLKGDMRKYRAFWIKGDLRVSYKRIGKNEVMLMDVGTHNQVY